MKIELNWLKYFYEVAQLESVTLAAKSLKISQPAVTKTIRMIEEASGFALFQKSGRKIKLTDEGHELLLICRKIFADLKTIQDVGSKKLVTGEIKIGASDHLCYYMLPKLMKNFVRINPKVNFEIYSGVSSEIKSKLISGELDLGVFYTKLNLREQNFLQETKVGEVDFCVVIAKSPTRIKLAKNGSISALLKDATYVGARQSDYMGTLPEQWIYRKLGLNPEKIIQANSKEMQKRLVQSGLGYSVLPKMMIEREIANGSLIVLHTMRQDVICVQNKQSKSRRAVDVFKQEFIFPYFTKS